MTTAAEIFIEMGWTKERLTIVVASFPPTEYGPADQWSSPNSEWVTKAWEEAETVRAETSEFTPSYILPVVGL